jgi:hypothetical protein
VIELDDWKVSGSGDIMEDLGADRGVNGGGEECGVGRWGVGEASERKVLLSIASQKE